MKNFTRVMAFIISIAVSASAAWSHPYNINTAYARTVEEIEQERAANNLKIADLEAKLTALDKSRADEQNYQDMLTEQLKAISDNISLLTAEIDQLSQDIESAQARINELDASIASQQDAIDEKVEMFKQRLCEMYISTNDNIATILVGTSTFYDMISRVEMLNRVADYDQKLIDDILSEIDSMEAMKSTLDTEKAELEVSVQQQQASVEAKNDEIQLLNDKIESSRQQIDAITHESLLLSGSKADLDAENAKLEKECEEAHAKIAQEAQRLYEEEMRQRALQGNTVTGETTKLKVSVITTTVPVVTEKPTTPKPTTQPTTKKQTTQAVTRPVETTYVTAEPTTEEPTLPPTTLPPTTTPEPETQAPTTEPPTTEAPVVAETPSYSEWTWPVPGHYNISSHFGYRASFGEFHKGIDISDINIYGVPVVAARSGIVSIVRDGCTHDWPKTSATNCGCNGNFGNYVQISHDSSTYSRYGHMKSIAVTEGQYVKQGDVIGYVGCTGWSTGNHLHFDINSNGSWVDPQQYLNY